MANHNGGPVILQGVTGNKQVSRQRKINPKNLI